MFLFIFNTHKTTMSLLISFVFYFLLYIFLHSGLNTKVSGGRREKLEKVLLEEDKQEEKIHLSVGVIIILIYHCMTKRHLQCFSYSPSQSFFMKPLHSALLSLQHVFVGTCSLSLQITDRTTYQCCYLTPAYF